MDFGRPNQGYDAPRYDQEDSNYASSMWSAANQQVSNGGHQGAPPHGYFDSSKAMPPSHPSMSADRAFAYQQQRCSGGAPWPPLHGHQRLQQGEWPPVQMQQYDAPPDWQSPGSMAYSAPPGNPVIPANAGHPKFQAGSHAHGGGSHYGGYCPPQSMPTQMQDYKNYSQNMPPYNPDAMTSMGPRTPQSMPFPPSNPPPSQSSKGANPKNGAARGTGAANPKAARPKIQPKAVAKKNAAPPQAGNSVDNPRQVPQKPGPVRGGVPSGGATQDRTNNPGGRDCNSSSTLSPREARDGGNSSDGSSSPRSEISPTDTATTGTSPTPHPALWPEPAVPCAKLQIGRVEVGFEEDTSDDLCTVLEGRFEELETTYSGVKLKVDRHNAIREDRTLVSVRLTGIGCTVFSEAFAAVKELVEQAKNGKEKEADQSVALSL